MMDLEAQDSTLPLPIPPVSNLTPGTHNRGQEA
jgi:hypothetical protein